MGVVVWVCIYLPLPYLTALPQHPPNKKISFEGRLGWVRFRIPDEKPSLFFSKKQASVGASAAVGPARGGGLLSLLGKPRCVGCVFVCVLVYVLVVYGYVYDFPCHSRPHLIKMHSYTPYLNEPINPYQNVPIYP